MYPVWRQSKVSYKHLNDARQPFRKVYELLAVRAHKPTVSQSVHEICESPLGEESAGILNLWGVGNRTKEYRIREQSRSRNDKTLHPGESWPCGISGTER